MVGETQAGEIGSSVVDRPEVVGTAVRRARAAAVHSCRPGEETEGTASRVPAALLDVSDDDVTDTC